MNTCTVNYRGDRRESLLIIPLWQDEVWLSPELGHPWLLNALVACQRETADPGFGSLDLSHAVSNDSSRVADAAGAGR